MSEPVDALRRAFLDYFVAADHVEVASASLQPHDPTLLFTVAGMVPFKSYFVGDEPAPFPRAVSSQKCVRAGGKHNDLDDIGRTSRHASFFEMLGNFSFGDYFKHEAIRLAWEFVTGVLKLPADRLWVTVHLSDDEAATIWAEEIGIPADRIQRLDADNFWQMADTGPCGPCSEIFWDLGPEFGAEGGPAHGGSDRYIEIWNLVFMQYEQQADGSRVELPRPSIDTGAGLERLLMAVEGVGSVWETSLFRPLIATAESLTGASYGTAIDTDISLRILAEHARSICFLIADGVVPSNEDRGYVLRRILRRAVLHAYRLGVETLVTPSLVESTIAVMQSAYPELTAQRARIVDAARREEERFRITLARGLERVGELLEGGSISGQDAFFLHDTLGFPIDLTRELATERGIPVDLDGFAVAMQQQRDRAKAAHKAANSSGREDAEQLRSLQALGPTKFLGRELSEVSDATVIGILDQGAPVDAAGAGATVDVFLDRTPFYAESGGQIGDQGTLEWDGGSARVMDAQWAAGATLVRHIVNMERGTLLPGQRLTAKYSEARRSNIRRHHTATHLLHWALREVLGDHVAQAGSLVTDERLRFDFSHHQAVTRDELDRVEDLVNTEVLSNASVSHDEMSKAEAEAMGAIAFFGDKYGDTVRVLRAGPNSLELCGGTHVRSLGEIGLVRVLTEGSIGANTRRIEAVAGTAAFEHIRVSDRAIRRISEILKCTPDETVTRAERLVARAKSLEGEVASMRARDAETAGVALAGELEGGGLVKRIDGLTPEIARRMLAAARSSERSGIIGIIGTGSEPGLATIAVCVSADLVDRGLAAATIASTAAKLLKGGTARSADIVAGGGKDAGAIAAALETLRVDIAAALVSLGARSGD